MIYVSNSAMLMCMVVLQYVGGAEVGISPGEIRTLELLPLLEDGNSTYDEDPAPWSGSPRPGCPIYLSFLLINIF